MKVLHVFPLHSDLTTNGTCPWMAHNAPLACGACAIVAWMPTVALAQKTLTWEEAKREFEAANPTLRAARIGIQESRADEITAFLRPNPDLTVSVDQFSPLSPDTPYRPFTDAQPFIAGSYLIERRHKRELRRESAQEGTAIAVSELADQERNLLFDLRSAFVQVLQQKAVLAVTRESLDFYDRMLGVSRDRYKAGDIAQVDLDRLELQRVQFETDVQTALVNLRTAKIQLRDAAQRSHAGRAIGRERAVRFHGDSDPVGGIPAERFRFQGGPAGGRYKLWTRRRRITGLPSPTARPIPRFEWDVGHQQGIRASVGVGVTIPLRIFDRNQGEKARTQLDIKRNERLVEANRAQVFSDVDSAYATLQSDLDPPAAVQDAISATSGARAGDDFVFVSAWRGLTARFPAGTAGLPRHPTELSEPGGVFSKRRQPNEFCGGT